MPNSMKQDHISVERSTQKQVITRDGVTLSVTDTGDTGKPALLFVHGLTQSSFAFRAQFLSERLRARFRLVAFDLRGHGRSQGAFGAVAADGRALPLLEPEHYHLPGDRAGTSRLWANDIEAVIEGLGLHAPAIIGWSYGGVVACDYMATHGGLGAASKVMLIASTPGCLPPGAEGIGGDQVFMPEVPAAVFRTIDIDPMQQPAVASTAEAVISGLTDFVALTLRDTVSDRPPASRDDILSAMTYNLRMPPAARQAALFREIDHRPFLSGLPDADKARIRVLCGTGDAVMQSVKMAAEFQRCGLNVDILSDEGHSFFLRNPAPFEERLVGWG